MLFLFSKNRKIGSRLIQYGLNEPVSHFSMAFDESPKGYGILFHAHFSGVSIEWFGDWRKRNEIVYAYTFKRLPSLELEERIYQLFVRRFYGARYDTLGLLFWAKCIIMHKLCGWPIPLVNKWGDPLKYLCYEIYAGLSSVPELALPTIEPDEMISPDQLRRKLRESESLIDVSKMFI